MHPNGMDIRLRRQSQELENWNLFGMMMQMLIDEGIAKAQVQSNDG